MDIATLTGTLLRLGAPLLATALGGPAAGAVVGSLATALGTDATPEAVASAIEQGPDTAATIATVEAKQGAALAELNAVLADVQNARSMQITAVQAASWTAYTPHVLAYLLALSFILTIAALFFKALPENNIVMVLIGALVSEFRGSLAFFFGSSSASKGKDDTIRQMSQSAPAQIGAALGTAINKAVRR